MNRLVKQLDIIFKSICTDENSSLYWISKCVGLFKYTFLASVMFLCHYFFFRRDVKEADNFYMQKFRIKLLKLKIWHGCSKKISTSCWFLSHDTGNQFPSCWIIEKFNQLSGDLTESDRIKDQDSLINRTRPSVCLFSDDCKIHLQFKLGQERKIICLASADRQQKETKTDWYGVNKVLLNIAQKKKQKHFCTF